MILVDFASGSVNSLSLTWDKIFPSWQWDRFVAMWTDARLGDICRRISWAEERERVISPSSDKTINTDNLISRGQGRRLWVIHHKQGHPVDTLCTWLSHAPWYLHFTWGTASKCHADYVASIMMTDCLVCSWHSSCHDVTPDKWGRSIRDWPRTWLGSVQWQHISHDQETRPHTPRVCSHVRCWVISWLSELLNILYWGILLRMSGVVLKASQYLAGLFQWSKWASQMDFQKFYNFHIFSHHRPHIKISKEPSSISWYPLWRW